jgi:hypothetical protein
MSNQSSKNKISEELPSHKYLSLDNLLPLFFIKQKHVKTLEE